MDEKSKVIENDGVYSCPFCRSKKINLCTQAVLKKNPRMQIQEKKLMNVQTKSVN